MSADADHGKKPGEHVPAVLGGADKVASLASPMSIALGATRVGSALGVAAPALGLGEVVWKLWHARQEARVRALLDNLLLENASDEGFQAALAGELERESLLRDVLLESVRSSVEAIDDAVLPALAAVVREYRRTGTGVDGFFRGYCRMLQDLLRREFESLQHLLRQAASELHGAENIVAAFQFTLERDHKVSVARVYHPDIGLSHHVMHGHRLAGSADTERNLRLAAANGIGAMVGSDQPSWQVERAVLTKLAQLIAPGSLDGEAA